VAACGRPLRPGPAAGTVAATEHLTWQESAMFFELRQYRLRPGKRAEWIEYMEGEIIPFQISKGMVVIGSFVGEEEEDLYVWIRRFDSEEQREQLYAAVYEDEEWVNVIGPKVGTLIDREKIVVQRIEPTPRSVIR